MGPGTSGGLDDDLENRLRQEAYPLLQRGRPGDWEHTLRALGYAKELMAKEGGDPLVVIPTLYLHDIGWSAIDYTDFLQAPIGKKRFTGSLKEHMEEGARLARGILRRLDLPPRFVERIVHIISIHDLPDKIFSMGDISATIIMEADKLDRFGPESVKRYTLMFGESNAPRPDLEEGFCYLREGIRLWFRSRGSRTILKRLLQGTPLWDFVNDEA